MILKIVPNFGAASYANGEPTGVRDFNSAATEQWKNEAPNL